VRRLHTTAPDGFFSEFVYRYHDKQYQTWLGADFTKVGIDFDYNKNLLDHVFAGIASYFFDYSFKSALKLAEGEPRDDRIPIFEKKFDKIENRFFATSNAFLSPRQQSLRDQDTPIAHAELFMTRLLSSFKAARYLMNWGFFSEPLTILRSSLEQLAWCYSVGVTFDERQLADPQPSKCIGPFRARFQAAGSLYGALSRFSHMEFEAQKHFIARNTDTTFVIQQSIEFKFFGLICYAFLLISYQYVCRDLANFYQKQYDLHFNINNIVIPLRYLVAHALLRPELDKDEIAVTLSQIYFQIFP
jgi:hypothetical protein